MRPSQTLAPTRSSKAPILAACAVALLGITSSAAATAQTPGERAAMDRKRQVAEVEARQEIEALFSRLCPGRCELIEVRAIVREAIAELGVKDAKQAGRVVGHIMKSGREGLDGKLVNQLVRAELSA